VCVQAVLLKPSPVAKWTNVTIILLHLKKSGAIARGTGIKKQKVELLSWAKA